MKTESDKSSPAGAVGRAIERIGLEPGPASTCPYLARQQSRNAAFQVDHLPPGAYRSLMDLNFRRSGRVIYRPACETCHQCRAIRVPVADFQPNRSQRRCRRLNRDLTFEFGPPVPTEEKHALYGRYLQHRHDGQMGDSWEDFVNFLYASPVKTGEVVYRLDGQIIGVGIVDIEPRSVSTVYCYFDPIWDRRSLGTFNILWTLEFCRRHHLEYLYLGYYIADCARMNYKANFQPCQVLTDDGGWKILSR